MIWLQTCKSYIYNVNAKSYPSKHDEFCTRPLRVHSNRRAQSLGCQTCHSGTARPSRMEKGRLRNLNVRRAAMVNLESNRDGRTRILGEEREIWWTLFMFMLWLRRLNCRKQPCFRLWWKKNLLIRRLHLQLWPCKPPSCCSGNFPNFFSRGF